MKKIFAIFAIIAISFSITSCRGEGERVYGGDSQLLFNAPRNTGNALVLQGTGSADYKLTFGVVKPSDVDNQVTVEVDPTNTNAVEGVDYTIPSKTTTLQAGSSTGFFTIKLLEGGATQAGKKIAFKIKSATLQNAGFNQDFTLIVNLTCPVSAFVGNFNYTGNYWNNPNTPFKIVNSTVANQLLVKDFFDIGFDLVLNYDPATYVVTIPAGQSTNNVDSRYGLILATQSSDTSQISKFNPCTRKMDLYIKYYVDAGSFGNKQESFVGN